MDTNKYIKIINEYESEPEFVAFDNLDHLAANIANRTGDSLEIVTGFVYGYFSASPDNVTHAAAALGRKGGQSTSAAKKVSSAANGRKGGRPVTYNTVKTWLEKNRPDLRADEINGTKGVYCLDEGPAASFHAMGQTWKQVLENLKIG